MSRQSPVLRASLRSSSAAKVKSAWMDAFSDQVVAAEPGQLGRIKWADATHFFNCHYTPKEAAEKYLSALRNS